ncbi:MAG: HAL/PAL/TAL family ammonia-lyase, partial [Cetobacterium sp.]
AKKLQKNIILSHAISVGKTLDNEKVRAIMLLVLLNSGSGYSGVRIETLERYRYFLNNNIIPLVPGDGSVGYLGPEAHIAAAVIGIGKVRYNNEIYEAEELFKILNIEKFELSYKEGLSLVSGTTSSTALATLAIFDLIKAVKTADIIGALNLEISKGTIRAFDERLMSIRPHLDQKNTADNIRTILKDSLLVEESYNYRLQDALSLRAIPQTHGAAKKSFYDAKKTIEIELNSSTDNPIIWHEETSDLAESISGCNCDSGYVGLEMDSCCIAATYLAKISERRNNRLINANLSEFPWFLINNPGLNSGLMIPQYTQAGLLNEMRILSTSSTIDNTPTCGDQEDYVSMGYTACKKANLIADKLEYILAIELLSIFRANQILDLKDKVSTSTKLILNFIGKDIPMMDEDVYLYPIVEKLKNYIKNGEILKVVEMEIGKLK